ncbi:iron uptake system protein EfeO [Bordetella sp. 15P40C-2]|uniref:iron uptake system protein EfeO n=1 Tax=Bordetella sp. 15P40C-2 TaxID=2572246 RepID=UPI0013248B34|nr:iron uptake system protein EfeO [Bordetella sp. 15P40C-2]MVW71670.1 multidrug DMT transporter permease [Bordetella sp. 15P40C-2]
MSSSKQNKRSPLKVLAVAASGLLALAGMASFWWASTLPRAQTGDESHAVRVTIRDNVCDPNDITVPAGRTTFVITNASSRALEWEILDGVMVVEERENIAPGISQTLRVKLSPGQFQITCGLLSNPRGTLTVTPSAASDAEAAKPSLVAYVGPLAEYRVTLLTQAAALQKALQAAAVAEQAGDHDQARQAYIQAHQAYARMEPVADLFADLDARLNVRSEYLQQRENDAAFVGLYRLQHALYGNDALDHARPIIEALQVDASALRERLRTLSIEPAKMASGAARVMQRMGDRFTQDAKSLPPELHADIMLAQGEGAERIAQLLAPLVGKSDPALQQQIDQRFAAWHACLEAYRQEPDEASAARLSQTVQSVEETLAQINDKLGLE